MDLHTDVEFDIAEVLEYDRTYQYDESSTDKLFVIKVRSIKTFNKIPFEAIPADNNIKKIPLIGEYVLIYKTINSEATAYQRRTQRWYYLTTVNLQSSVHANLLPGISDRVGIDTKANDDYKPGKTFNLTTISPLQPYEGDVIVEGRFGNSIRFSNTVKIGGDYYKPAGWSGTVSNDTGDPIIILSNRTKNLEARKFVTEDIQTDASSLYLTSTQTLTSFTLGTTENPNPLSCFLPGESSFKQSQLIGVADRVILKAKSDIAVIDSPRGIVLNTTGDVRIGNDEASEAMVHGDVLLNILQKILNQLNSPIQCGSMTGTFIDKSYTVSAQKQLQDLLSSTYFIKKNTY